MLGKTVECVVVVEFEGVLAGTFNMPTSYQKTSGCGKERLRRSTRRYFQHAHFIPIVGVGKRGAY